MNEILQILGNHFSRGRFVISVHPDDRANPRGIVVGLSDGKEHTHPINVRDRDEFARLWHEGFALWNFKWGTVDPPEPLTPRSEIETNKR